MNYQFAYKIFITEVTTLCDYEYILSYIYTDDIGWIGHLGV